MLYIIGGKTDTSFDSTALSDEDKEVGQSLIIRLNLAEVMKSSE